MSEQKPLNFEENLTNLENIVTEMNKGDLSLEELVKKYEEGMTLLNKLQEQLNQVEQKIQVVTSNNN